MPTDSSGLLPDVVRERYTARLGVALAFAIVVMLAFGAVISAQATGELREDVERDLTSQASAQAAHLDTWVSSVTGDVRTTSTLSVFASDDTDEIKPYLDRMIDRERVPEDVVAVHYMDTADMEFLTSSNGDMIGVSPAEQGAAFATDPPTFDGTDDVHVSEPFSVPIVDHPIVAVISPVEGAEDRALVYMADLEKRAAALAGGNGTSTVVVNGAGEYVAHPNASKILTQHEHDIGDLSAGDVSFAREDETVMGMARMSSLDWTVMAHMSTDRAYALAGQINADLLGLVLLAVINLGLIGVTIGSNTALSLRRLADRAEAMGGGDLEVDLTTDRDDEIGSLYAALADMRDSLREQIAEADAAREDAESAREEAERERAEMKALSSHLETKAAEYGDVLDDVADGNLTRRVDPKSDNEAMATVGAELNEALDALEATIADVEAFAEEVARSSSTVQRNADQVSQASRQVGESIDEIFDGASEQSERLQDIATEMENLSASAEQVASSAQQVAATSREAAEVGQTGQRAAEDAISEMNAIEAETERTRQAINDLAGDVEEIGEIVDLITQIVDQTNMLAINASIEAAHSGGGEGFAVVADEIKELAEETKDAAGDIERRIEAIQSQAGETVETMESTSERMSEGVATVTEAVESLETIVEHAEEADRGIQEIDDATEDQAETAQQVMAMVDDLTAISQQTTQEADTVAAAADDQTDSIAEVSDSADELGQRAEELRDLLERFEVDRAGEASRTATAQED